MLAIIEFILTQAGKHDVSDTILSKDLMQMGMAVESANGVIKVYSDNQEQLVKSMKNQTLRLSSLNDMQYKLSYLMASSMTGKKLTPVAEGSEDLVQEPLDIQVTLNLNMKQFPHDKQISSFKNVKMSMGRDKFL